MNFVSEFFDQTTPIVWSAVLCVSVTLFFLLRSAVDDDAVKSAQSILQWPSEHDGRVLKPAELGGTSNGRLMCHDPSTLRMLGEVKIFSEADVKSSIARSKAAQKEWAATSFGERRRVMRVLLQLVLDNADRIAAVAARDSGKTNLDAMIGEVMTVCEKIRCAMRQPLLFLMMQPCASYTHQVAHCVWRASPAKRIAQLRATHGLDQDVADRVAPCTRAMSASAHGVTLLL